jgi:hypothetical protein
LTRSHPAAAIRGVYPRDPRRHALEFCALHGCSQTSCKRSGRSAGPRRARSGLGAGRAVRFPYRRTLRTHHCFLASSRPELQLRGDRRAPRGELPDGQAPASSCSSTCTGSGEGHLSKNPPQSLLRPFAAITTVNRPQGYSDGPYEHCSQSFQDQLVSSPINSGPSVVTLGSRLRAMDGRPRGPSRRRDSCGASSGNRRWG